MWPEPGKAKVYCATDQVVLKDEILTPKIQNQILDFRGSAYIK
jgi:hypothetical protein